MKKPKVKFCWECGRKLRGNHFKREYHDFACRTMHKSCEHKEDYSCNEDDRFDAQINAYDAINGD